MVRVDVMVHAEPEGASVNPKQQRMSETDMGAGYVTTSGLEPRYMRERRNHEFPAADADALTPELAPAADDATGVLHSVDEATPELRHRIMETRTDLGDVVAEVVHCVCCLLPLALCRERNAGRLVSVQVSPA